MTATFRKLAFAAFLSVSALGTMTMTSCNKDETCDAGYEGSDCKTEVRTKFINASGWNATEVGSSSGGSTYSVGIKTTSTAVDKILITNVWNTFKADVVATVSGTTFTIARQQPDNDKFFVQGTGSINGSTITVDYTVTDESGLTVDTDNVKGTWTKK